MEEDAGNLQCETGRDGTGEVCCHRGAGNNRDAMLTMSVCPRHSELTKASHLPSYYTFRCLCLLTEG